MSILFDRLLDDAAIFPPGNAPMDVAVSDHVAATESPIARHVGPFVCSASRLDELRDALTETGAEQIDLTLVAQVGPAAMSVATVQEDPRLRLRAVEIAPPSPSDDLPAVPDGTLLVAERSTTPPFDLPDGVALKLRAGGETPDAFPDEQHLAAAIGDAVGRGLRLKLTAGLHHAVRHRDDETGFEHHGFLNVILAVHEGLSGGSADDLTALLGLRDADDVVRRVAHLDESARGLVRAHFLSFGTCSISEPLDDLRDLGLLGAAA